MYSDCANKYLYSVQTRFVLLKSVFSFVAIYEVLLYLTCPTTSQSMFPQHPNTTLLQAHNKYKETSKQGAENPLSKDVAHFFKQYKGVYNNKTSDADFPVFIEQTSTMKCKNL